MQVEARRGGFIEQYGLHPRFSASPPLARAMGRGLGHERWSEAALIGDEGPRAGGVRGTLEGGRSALAIATRWSTTMRHRVGVLCGLDARKSQLYYYTQ